MKRIQTVWDHFSSLVYRQFGCHTSLTHFLNSKKLPKKEILEMVIKNKRARIIFIQDDLVFPITKTGSKNSSTDKNRLNKDYLTPLNNEDHLDGTPLDENHLYGYISIFKGIKLLPDQIEKIQMLIDLLIRSVLLAEHKKQVTSNIETFLEQQVRLMKNQSKKQPTNSSQVPTHIANSHKDKVFSLSNAVSIDPRYPVFILAHDKKTATQEAYNIHVQSQLLQFLHIGQLNHDQLLYPELISYLGHITIYIPEITTLPLTVQMSLEKYFQSFYQYAKFRCPRIIVATTQPICKLDEMQRLIDQKLIYKPLLCHLVRSRVLHACALQNCVHHVQQANHTHPPRESKDIQNLIRYLFHTENMMDNVIFMKPKALTKSN